MASIRRMVQCWTVNGHDGTQYKPITPGVVVRFVLWDGAVVSKMAISEGYGLTYKTLDELNTLTDEDIELRQLSNSPYEAFAAVLRTQPDACAAVISVGDGDEEVVKAFCLDCSCLVSVFGHVSRCDKTLGNRRHEEVDRMRRMAWLGDAKLALDVRELILSAGVPSSATQLAAEKVISRDSQAKAYGLVMAKMPLEMKSFGDTIKQRSAAFEANYHLSSALRMLRYSGI